MAHLAFFVHGDKEARGFGGFAAGGVEFQLRSLWRDQGIKLGRKTDHGRNGLGDELGHQQRVDARVAIFPGAQFIASYDAGRGQRYYIFGSPATFVELVAYYRTVLKQKGELVYEVPATHEFDVGKYREETMAFPPGVTIKDYESDVSAGYPNPKPGGQPARFPTLIQIVPVTEKP